MYSTFEAAKKLKKSDQTVRRACKRLGFPKVGISYIIDEIGLELLRHEIKNQGQPKKIKNKL